MKNTKTLPQPVPSDLEFPSRADLPMLVDPRPQLAEINKLFAQLPTAADPEAVRREIERLSLLLPSEDGIPMEIAWHFAAINLLMDILNYFWKDRTDFCVAGNMFIYYGTSRSMVRDFVGPDFYYVSGVKRDQLRKRWIVWLEEDRFPDVIVEFISPSTAREDRTTKKTLYERTFQTPEYFCFDPETSRLEGWRLRRRRYQPIPVNERGWMWSEQFQLWVGTWEGEYRGTTAWLRFYDAQGQLVLKADEAARQRADAAQQQADAAKQQAHAAQQHAHAAEQRANTAELELARLKALLVQKESAAPTPEKPD